MNITLAVLKRTKQWDIFLSFLLISFLENFPSKYNKFQIDKVAKILEIENAKNRLSVSSHCNFSKLKIWQVSTQRSNSNTKSCISAQTACQIRKLSEGSIREKLIGNTSRGQVPLVQITAIHHFVEFFL